MKITKLTTHWEIDQVITLLGFIDELREALIYTYQDEIEAYQQDQWNEQQKRREKKRELFDDEIEF